MNKKELNQKIRQTDPEVILKCIKVCDGHTIFETEAFTELGLDPEIAQEITKTYTSDGSWKGSIWDDNLEQLEKARGIYGLDLLEAIVKALGIKTNYKMGRGFRAREYKEAIEKEVTK